ncbi:transcription factor IIIB 50 kDa subunit [Emydura macquarii macquarii]|uniref:transcription factor IIIB 50 kDa subunit n=1 Tax=Emydura macquarii macquarii TaxID=1129001 RepID=UPI00352AF6B5
MSGRRRCPDCGSAAIVEDAHYAQSQLVCSDCGCVLTEGLLTTTFAEEEHFQEVTYSRSTGQNEQLSRCKQRGIKRVQDLCKVLRLPTVFEDTALTYFHRAIDHPAFHLVSLEKKEILVGCCVFVTCRQHNWPLTMGTICSLLYGDKELFASVYLCILQELDLEVPALSLTDLVKTHLNSFKLFQQSATLPAKFAEDQEKMVTRTTQLVELASETWLVTGRHPIPIITAAAYLAWQSLQPVGRLTCPFPRFCKLAGTDLPPPALLRLKELKDILLTMASELPWLRVLSVDKKSVVKHIGDLLQHRHFLLKHAFSSRATEGQSTSTLDTPEGDGSKRSPSPDAAAGKRPLLPPCLINPKKRLRTAPLSPSAQTVTGDEAISDSEIEQYLRSQEEMWDFSKAQGSK